MSRRSTGPALLAAALLGLALAGPAAAGEPYLAADEALRRAAIGELVVIDVRSPTEWQHTGIPAGAKALTIHDPDGEEGFVNAVNAALEGKQGTPIAVICASGTRSARAQAWLRDHGFTDVYDIGEGMMGRGDQPGWLERGLPTEPCPSC